MPFRYTAKAQRFPLRTPFVIARGTKTEAVVVEVTLSHQGHTGRGEAVPYARYGETVESVLADIQQAASHLQEPDTAALQRLMPAGAARNALDAACWDWRARAQAQPVWRLAAVTAPNTSVATAYTISIDAPTKMVEKIVAEKQRNLFKIKLQGDSVDFARIAALYQAKPTARFILDANEGVQASDIKEYCNRLAPYAAAIVCLEQPVATKDDDCLFGLQTPFMLCADESCHTRADIASVAKKYGMINLKLDKAGGFSEAAALAHAAQTAGLKIMLGCMVGTSLAMAPAFMLNAYAAVIDLDGPLLLKEDRPHGFIYEADGGMRLPESFLWGATDASADS